MPGVCHVRHCSGDDKRLESQLAVFLDYSRVPVGASWKTSVTGRLPKGRKPWNKAKNSWPRLSCVVRMMIVVMVPDSPIGSGPSGFIHCGFPTGTKDDGCLAARRNRKSSGAYGLSAVAYGHRNGRLCVKRGLASSCCACTISTCGGLVANRAHDCNRIRARRTIRSYWQCDSDGSRDERDAVTKSRSDARRWLFPHHPHCR